MALFCPLWCKAREGWGGSAHYPHPTAQSAPPSPPRSRPGPHGRRGGRRGWPRWWGGGWGVGGRVVGVGGGVPRWGAGTPGARGRAPGPKSAPQGAVGADRPPVQRLEYSLRSLGPDRLAGFGHSPPAGAPRHSPHVGGWEPDPPVPIRARVAARCACQDFRGLHADPAPGATGSFSAPRTSNERPGSSPGAGAEGNP